MISNLRHIDSIVSSNRAELNPPEIEEETQPATGEDESKLEVI